MDNQPGGSHIPEISASEIKFSCDNWKLSQRYLYGIDLFNSGYWWEAHEVLEELWIQSGRTTQDARFLQGIIQISAALLKDSQANSTGANRLLSRGLAKMRQQTGLFMGINLSAFFNNVENYFVRKSASALRINLIG